MDLNNVYWTQQNSQQNQTFVVPIIPSTSTIYYPSTTLAEISTGLSASYNPIHQSAINLQATNQQVRVISQNLPSTSNDFDQENFGIACSIPIKTESQYQHDQQNHSNTSKTSQKYALCAKKKVSNELDFLENKNSDEIGGLEVNITNTKSGTLQQRPKRLGPTCRQDFCRKSKLRFCPTFDEETRQRIFDEFWNKLNCDQRHIYVATRVFRKPVIRRQSDKESRRSYTLIYTLRNSNGNSEQVCRDMFLNTLNISERQVALWVKKYSIGGNGVSQAKLEMFKLPPGKQKVDKEKDTQNTVKQTRNSSTTIVSKCENKTDVEFLSHLLDYDDKNVSNIDELNCGKTDEYSSTITVPKKPKRKRNRIDPNCPDKPTRKRNSVPNPEFWKRNVIKRLRLEGKAYKSGPRGQCTDESDLIERKAKALLPTCNSPQCNTSRLRHCSTISEWRREQIFNDFWNKWDWNQRKIFVASMVTRKEPHRKRLKTELISRRQTTLIYNLPNDHGIPVQICRKMFINTTGVSGSQVSRWIRKYSLGSKIEEKIISRKDATTHACEWLDRLPKIKAIVNGEERFYLDPEFKAFINFYHTYCDIYYKEQGRDDCVVKKYLFMSMCRIKKISLMPQNDVDDINCKICKEHIKKNNTNNNWEQHKLKKERGKMEKLHDLKLAKSNRAIVLSVHLQPIKCVPILKNSVALYKSKLNCYNFTIYDLKTQFSHCYWFSEDQCGQLVNNNSPESVFTSIIYNYIQDYCLTKKLPIIIYSDGQLEQTRNYILSNALLNLSIINGIQILQKFSEPGHSLADDCFKVNTTFDKYIYVKKKEIFLPSQLAKAMREVKRTPKLFHGTHLDYDYFNDFSKTEYLRYNSINPVDANGLTETLNEKDICAIKYDSNGRITIKFYFDDEWIELSHKVNDVKPILEYPKLYTGMAKISKTKWDDLQDLKLSIPFDCQPFYDSIKYFED